MLWELRFGRDKFSIEAAIEKGRELPSWLEDEPYIEPGHQFYLSAWFDLTTCRSVGFSSGPIPWDRIVQYGEFHGLDNEALPLFISVIRLMDTKYLEQEARESKAK